MKARQPRLVNKATNSRRKRTGVTGVCIYCLSTALSVSNTHQTPNTFLRPAPAASGAALHRGNNWFDCQWPAARATVAAARRPSSVSSSGWCNAESKLHYSTPVMACGRARASGRKSATGSAGINHPAKQVLGTSRFTAECLSPARASFSRGACVAARPQGK